jgi:hypothetical protein
VASLATLPADAEAILTEFAVALNAIDVEVPERIYLNDGLMVAWDAPQFTIAVIRIYPGQPGAEDSQSQRSGQYNWSVSFGLLFLQKVAVGKGQSPRYQDLDSDGQSITGLMPIFINTAVALREADKLSPLGGSVVIGPCATVGPQGGLAGVSLQLDMSIL